MIGSVTSSCMMNKQVDNQADRPSSCRLTRKAVEQSFKFSHDRPAFNPCI
jgi:hypothetical protein